MVECLLRNSTLFFMGQNKTIVDDGDGTAYRFGLENGYLYIEED